MADPIRLDTPRGMIRLHDGRNIARRHGWIEPGEPLRCPFNHVVTPSMALHEGAVTIPCKVRPETGHAACGCLLYVATGVMGFFWLDITEDEDAEIRRLGIRPTGIARFLGIKYTGLE